MEPKGTPSISIRHVNAEEDDKPGEKPYPSQARLQPAETEKELMQNHIGKPHTSIDSADYNTENKKIS